MKYVLLLLTVSFGFTGRSLMAQAPMTFSYQGVLTDQSGTPVPDGAQSLTFRLYTTASGGTAIWTETFPSVATSKGLFQLELGSITPLSGVNFRQPLYLGISRGADPELSPRASLTSTPGSMAPWSRGTTAADISFTGGKVGIGTQSPNYALHVQGDMAVSGPVYSFGYKYLHTRGFWNFFVGPDAGGSIHDDTGVRYNTGGGYKALGLTTIGQENTGLGAFALYGNVSGSYNTAIGRDALRNTTTSQYNTAIGANAGKLYDNGWNNVFVGANTDVSGASGLFNVIAIGQATVVSASSTARFGNSATVSYGGWAGWSNVSDGRFKKNVREDVPGLAFINRLRPVRYTFDATAMDAFQRRNENAGDAGTEGRPEPQPVAEAVMRRALEEKEQITYTGFVAQEVEAAARELNFDFSGVDGPKNPNDYYSLRYAEFVVPLVKAVQEQQEMIEAQQRTIDALVREVRELTNRIGSR